MQFYVWCVNFQSAHQLVSLFCFFTQTHTYPAAHTHMHIFYLATQQHGSADLARKSAVQVDRGRVQRVSTEAADTSACLISPGNWACSIYFSAEMQSGAGSWHGSLQPAIRCIFFSPSPPSTVWEVGKTLFCATLRGEKVCLVIVCKFFFNVTHIQEREKAGNRIKLYCLELNTLNFPQLVLYVSLSEYVQDRWCIHFFVILIISSFSHAPFLY